MSARRTIRRIAVTAGGCAVASMGILAVAHTSTAAPSPLTPGDPASSPTASPAPSYAPANPVDCTDPNNVINCQSPPIDSPLVVGTAIPGSPYRD